MKKAWVTAVLAAVCLAASLNRAAADIVEIKGEGYVNGDVISEDDQKVEFKDNHGKMRTLARKDVMYLQKEDKTKMLKNKAADAWDAIKRAPQSLKRNSDLLTQKFIGSVGKPLDRSAADAKADSLARTMDDASKASAELTKKNMAVNREVNRQAKEAYETASASEEKKGRFASLDS